MLVHLPRSVRRQLPWCFNKYCIHIRLYFSPDLWRLLFPKKYFLTKQRINSALNVRVEESVKYSHYEEVNLTSFVLKIQQRGLMVHLVPIYCFLRN